MLKNIEVLIDENDFEMLKIGNNIIGQIFFKTGEHYFPQNHWTDFIVVVLSWWLEAIYNLQNAKTNSSCKFMFMDGPYLIKAVKIGDDIIEMDFIESDKLVFRTKCSLSNLKESILMAARLVLEKMEQRIWNTNDIKKLKLLVE